MTLVGAEPPTRVSASALGGRVRQADLGGLLVAVVAGFVVRAYPVVTHGFPLNDGGLFVRAVDGIEASGFGLPQAIQYNGLAIPFTYPPLGFYAAALLDVATPLDLLEVLRWAPLVVSLLMIPAFYLVAGSIMGSRFKVWVATFAFAVVPRGFEWMIAGGGITRAPGMLFALLAIAFGLRLMRRGRRRDSILTGLFAGLTALSHPEAALFALLTLTLTWLLLHRGRVGLVRLAGAGVIAAAVAAPWWGSVIARYGVGSLISAGGTGTDPLAGLVDLATFSMTGEPYFPIVAALGLLGLIKALSERRPLLPVWFVVLFLVDERAAATNAMVPLAMLAGTGLVDVVLATIDPAIRELPPAVVFPGTAVRRAARYVLPAAQALMFAGGLVAAAAPLNPLFALSPADRAALHWLGAETPPSARVLVVAGRPWQLDDVSEWLPALTAQTSVITVQGHEWLGAGAFAEQRKLHDAYTICAYETTACLAETAQVYPTAFQFIYVPSDPPPRSILPLFASAGVPCCAALQESIRADPHYRIVYDGPGAMIAEVASP